MARIPSLGAESGSQLGVQDLQCNGAIVPEIVSEKYGGHAATPKLALKPVAIRKAAPELLG